MSTTSRSLSSIAATTFAVLTLICIVMALGGLAAGYRPVVITTGSMGDAAPTGSLIVAGPRAADDIAVGDVVVMRRAGSAPITHRVIELRDDGDGRYALTKGDANADPDPTAYRLSDEELVARWTVPGLGSALESLRDPRLLLAILALMLVAATVVTLRTIWSGDDDDPPAGGGGRAPLPPPAAPLVAGQPLPPPVPASVRVAAVARHDHVLRPSPPGDARFRRRDHHGMGPALGAGTTAGRHARARTGDPATNHPVRIATLGRPAALQLMGAP